jgi:hypothetical protein
MAGYDTASFLQDVASAAKNTYGTPAFWIRYFSPSPNGTVNSSSSNATLECRAAWDNVSGHPADLGPISSPTQSRLSGTSAQGQADAQTFANAIHAVKNYLGSSIALPVNGTLFCWLDQEASTSLSLSYWNGWSGYIDAYVWPESQTLPLFPCLYCNPCSAPPNCSVIANGSANYCYAVWTTQPQQCGYSVSNPPPWAAKGCSDPCSNGYTGTPTRVWQYAEKTPCSLSVNVDMDLGGGINYGDYCLRITSRP